MNIQTNVDPAELEKFGALAHRWWDPNSEFRPLHDLNPVRVNWIAQHASLNAAMALDVGCGGGLLAEGLARQGAVVTGIDMSERPLGVAKLHLHESGLAVDYQLVSTESWASQRPGHYDIVTCMEMLEHVPDPQSIVKACAMLTKPGGQVFFSTLNRTPKAYAFAIVGAEYVMGLLPKGTHEYQRFIRPAELASWCRQAGLIVDEVCGLSYNPFNRQCNLSSDTDINYFLRARREG
jgi:2-polyprenyl-6-hydroxyphenyl methylase / 3-demethylubiquinone-9 3-methyltransferase